jgi:hypothetical protein
MTVDEPEWQAGDELDAIIAERVMGWTLHIADDREDDYSRSWLTGPNILVDSIFVHEFQPSVDITAAWQVVERLKLAVIPDVAGGYRAAKEPYEGPHWYEVNVNDWEWGETAPLAICRAALRVVS